MKRSILNLYSLISVVFLFTLILLPGAVMATDTNELDDEYNYPREVESATEVDDIVPSEKPMIENESMTQNDFSEDEASSDIDSSIVVILEPNQEIINSESITSVPGETEEPTSEENSVSHDSIYGEEAITSEDFSNQDPAINDENTSVNEVVDIQDPINEFDSYTNTDNENTEENIEELSKEETLHSLNPLSVERAPQFNVDVLDGHLVLRDLSTGEIRKDNKWVLDPVTNKMYFPNAQGHLYHDRFITFGPAAAYYMGSDGSKLSNQIVEVNNNLHLLNPDGLLNRSNRWTSFNSKEYFPNTNGRLYRNQFITFGPTVAYYMGSDGSKLSNQIVEVNNNLHLLNPDGLLNRSNRWTSFNGKEYFPNDKGTLYRNRFISFGPDVFYYLDNSGAKVTGQFEVNGINYTFSNTGRFVPTYRGWNTLKNQLYYFAANGFPTTGWFDVSGRTYHSDAQGIVSKGLKTVNRNVYYFDARSGVQYPNMVRNEKLSFGDIIYFFKQDGTGVRLSSAPLGSMQDGLYLTNNKYLLSIKNGLVTIDGTLIVNKSFTLPSTYNPGLTAATQSAYNSMKNAMTNQGMNLWIASGFRSYTRQSELFQQYANIHGVAAAETFSARPGHSEHQSGLAMDLNTISNSFANTREGIWLNNNAWRYGFILRYPQTKQSVTGYIYEPWHFRYVGTDLARKLYNNGSWLTIEEYFGIPSHY